MLIEALIFIIKKIQNTSKIVLVLVLVFVGMVMAEVALRRMGMYSYEISVSGRDLFKLFRASFASQEDIDEFKKIYYKFISHKQPADFTQLPHYTFRQLPIFDFDYGMGLLPNCKCMDIYKRNDEVIWSVENNIDSLGRRVTPAAENIETDKFVVFYGGSRTFGQGVKDDETVANQFQKLTSNYKVYNYGIIASAAQVFLKKHQNHVFQQQIPQKTGLFVYLFDFTHEDRILGSRYVPWSYKTPYYDLDDNKQLVLKGDFWNNRFFESITYQLLGSSAIYQNLFLDVLRKNQIELTSHDMEIIVKVFTEMQKEAEKFNNSRFAVVFFNPVSDKYSRNISEALNRNGIQTMTFNGNDKELSDYSIDNYFEYDGHPKPIIYKEEAQVLLKELTKRQLIVTK